MLQQVHSAAWTPGAADELTVVDGLALVDLQAARYGVVQRGDDAPLAMFSVAAIAALDDASDGDDITQAATNSQPLALDAGGAVLSAIAHDADGAVLLGDASAAAVDPLVVYLIGAPSTAYGSVADYRALLSDHPKTRPNAASNSAITMEIDAAAAIIDVWCRRSFRLGTTALTRKYQADEGVPYAGDDTALVYIADAVSVSEVKVNGAALADADWEPESSVGTPGWCIDQIRIAGNACYPGDAVTVTYIPGWETIPSAVTLCNVELAARRRLETPTAFGDAGLGSAEMVVSGDTRALLWRYLGTYRRELSG